MTRLHRILSDADTDLAELWLGLMVLMYGLAVLNPWSTVYASGPAFRALQQARVSEELYGSLTALAGAVHLWVILTRGLRARLLGMVWQVTGVWGTAALLSYGNPRGYGWLMFAVAGVMGLVMVWRLAERQERVRRRQAAWAEMWDRPLAER